MCRHAKDAAKISHVTIFNSKLACINYFFHFKFKALKTIQCKHKVQEEYLCQLSSNNDQLELDQCILMTTHIFKLS
jgi:hypothetical protein